MASRQFSDIQALNKHIKIITGKFSIAASGGAATKEAGFGWTVDNTTTGVYTITLEDSYPSLVSGIFTVEAATAVDLKAQIKSEDVVDNVTPDIVIDLLAVATPVEPTAVCSVHFVLFLNNSSLPYV